ncbi:MAG: CRISPR-associated endoribonuclease Cas6 [Deinococcales bacterium]
MRLQIELQGHLLLPVQYNHLLQGVIYNHLEPNLSAWLHDTAHKYNERQFKMFTFSRLTGEHTLHRQEKMLEFRNTSYLKIASSDSKVLSSFAETLLRQNELRIGNNQVRVQTVGIMPPPKLLEYRSVIVRTLSPITTYATLYDREGRKKTYYFAPTEPEWTQRILENLQRKARALGWDEQQVMQLEGSIRPINPKGLREVITSFKDTVIKAWNGTFEVSLLPAWLELALDTGLGSKNAQGFGMMEVI